MFRSQYFCKYKYETVNIIVFQNNAFVIFTHNWKFTGIWQEINSQGYNKVNTCQGDAIINGDCNGN